MYYVLPPYMVMRVVTGGDDDLVDEDRGKDDLMVLGPVSPAPPVDNIRNHIVATGKQVVGTIKNFTCIAVPAVGLMTVEGRDPHMLSSD